MIIPSSRPRFGAMALVFFASTLALIACGSDTVTPGGDGGADSGDSRGKDDKNGGQVTSLDPCFAGLPAAVGIQVVLSKSSSDNTVHLRMALDTMGNGGLAYSWEVVRFGIDIDGVVTCVSSKGSLSYSVTHHNCNDTASASAGGVRFELSAPSDVVTQLRIYSGSTLTRESVLSTDSCTRSDGAATCPSVGPC